MNCHIIYSEKNSNSPCVMHVLETQKRRPGDPWVSSAEFFIENALCGAAVIKSLTKAVLYCSWYTFRGQCLGMDSKHLGDDLKHANEVFRYSNLSHLTTPNPISITTQRLGQGHQEPLQTKGESLRHLAHLTYNKRTETGRNLLLQTLFNRIVHLMSSSLP